VPTILSAGTWGVSLSGLGGLSLSSQDEGPRQKFVDAADGTARNLGQDGAKVELPIETVQLGRSDQVIDVGGTSPPQSKPANR
jgi:hypothetical protein